MPCQLSAGAIEAMSTGKNVVQPILQILGYKKISSNNTDRYRVMVSDGVHSHAFAMLGTQLNPMVVNKELENFTVIRLEKFVCNRVQEDKNILVLLEVTVKQTAQEAGGKIGNPVTFNAANASSSSAARQDKPAPSIFMKEEPAQSRPTFQNKPATSSFGNQPAMKSPVKTPSHAQPKSSSSYGNRQPFPSNSSFTGTSPSNRVYPISSLTPYQNRWVIKARVMNKSNIRTWSNSRGEGKLFSFEMIDESGAIRITGFNDECDKFFNMLEVDKVYYVSNGTLKEANKKFTSVKNDYEMTLRRDSTIEPCVDDADSVPETQFGFVPFSDLPSVPKDSCIDVIGVCKSYAPAQTIVSRANQRELRKRELQLVDDTNKEVTLTLWGEEAEKFEGDANPVIAIRGVRVSDFGGVSLSMVMQSTLYINPKVDRAHVLQGWFDREGRDSASESLSVRGAPVGGGGGNVKTLKDIKEGDLGKGDKPDYVTCIATVVEVSKTSPCYKACSTDGCNKKVVESQAGLYRCEKCNVETSDFKWRLLLNVELGDHTDGMTAVAFHEAAEIILGKKADEVGSLMDTPKRLERILNRSLFKEFTFRLRVKMESYNDEFRLRNTIMSTAPVDYEDLSGMLLKDLQG